MNIQTSLKQISLIYIILILSTLDCYSQYKSSKKPNVIILLADDLGYDDLGFNGNTVAKTPFLDSLANASLRFTNFSVNAVCAPSRASLLTGKHFLKTGVSHVHGGKDYINLNETLLPQEFKKRGYATAMWGKWHSGNTIGYRPWERGFDEAYVAELYRHENNKGLLNEKLTNHKGRVDSILVDYAINFIHKKKETPFFAFIPFLAPHTPLDAPKKDYLYFKNKGFSKNFSNLYGMISHLDRQIGRLISELDKLELLENTLILFLSDNGPQFLTDKLTAEEVKIRNFSNRKGHKGNLYENGVKSPLFVMWKGKTASKKISEPYQITDIYSTILNLLDNKNYSKNSKKLDGTSFLSIINNKDKKTENDKKIFDFAAFGWAPSINIPYTLDGLPKEYEPILKQNFDWQKQTVSLKQGNYKLIQNPKNVDGYPKLNKEYVLYDLKNNPEETIDISSEKIEIFRDMKRAIDKWGKEILEEKNSFKSPIFLIDPKEVSTINCNGVFKHSKNLKNTVLELKGWKQKNDWAVYKIKVLESGNYKVKINYNSNTDANSSFLLKTNTDHQTKISLNSKPFKETLFLTKKDTIIKIQIKNSLKKTAFLNLESIEFTKQ